MARSGSVNFAMTGGDIIQKALALVADRAAEIALTDAEITDGLQSLNIMVKSWDSQGLHLWKREEGILFLDAGVTSYLLGPNGAEATTVDDFVNTELSVAAIASDTTITVNSTTNMSGASDIFTVNQATVIGSWTPTNATVAVASDKLTITNTAALAGFAELSLTDLIVGRDYRVTYGYEVGTSTSATFSVVSDSIILVTETVSSNQTSTLDFTATQTTATFRAANVSTTSGETTLVTAANYVDQSTGDFVGIQLDDSTRQWLKIVSISGFVLSLNGTIDSASALDNTVFTFSNLIERPLRVESARRGTINEQSEIPLNKWSRQQYFAQTNKTSEGISTNFYYTPKLDNGEMFIWQTASSINQFVKFTFQRPLQDFDSVSNNPDFPVEWTKALIWNLAVDLGPEYDVAENKMNRIERRAEQYLDDILGFDEEVTSLNVQPDINA